MINLIYSLFSIAEVYRYITVKDLHHTPRSTMDLTEQLKQGPNFPLTSRGHTSKNNDRLQSQDVASEYILKEIYFTPQNKNG